jgi:O-antigen ligase
MCLVALGAIRPFGGLDLSDWFFLASIAVVAGTVVARQAGVNPHLPGLFVFGFTAFALGAVFSLPVALHPAESAGAFARFTFTVVVWFALAAAVLRTRRHVEIAVAAWIVSIAISGIAAIVQVKWGALVFSSFTTLPSNAGGFATGGREIGLSGHPNDLGGAAAVVVAPAILFATSRIATEAQRYAFIGMLSLVLAAIALSGSVTAFAASIAAAAIWFLSGNVALRRLIIVSGVLTLSGLVLIGINQQGASSVLSPIDRVSSTLGLTTTPLATGLERVSLDAIAWDEIVRNPLYGKGLDGASVGDALGGVAVHNMFLLVWVGAGLFGALGLLLMVISLAAACFVESRQLTMPAERGLVLALGVSFMTFLIVSLAQPILFVRYGWVPAALLLALRAKRLRRDEVPPVVTLHTRQASSLTTSVPSPSSHFS